MDDLIDHAFRGDRHDDDFADGIAPVTETERAGWRTLPSGAEELAAAGGTPPTSGRPRSSTNGRGRGLLTVHAIASGDPS